MACHMFITITTSKVTSEQSKQVENFLQNFLPRMKQQPGVREIFSNRPVQMCHFHQVAIVRRYLTSRPKLEAAQEG